MPLRLTRHVFASTLTPESACAARQILSEDADADGLVVPELPDSAAREWSESRIRQHFAGAEQQALPADGDRSPQQKVRSCHDAHERPTALELRLGAGLTNCCAGAALPGI